jgi:NAD(P)-dependent dehydrogenase (short-subunit alcohol dehydrogenase family)
MKSVIVTGGAGGIGADVCQAFAALGYRVGVFDQNKDAAEAAASRVSGGEAFQCDVTDEASIARAVEAFGAMPDVLVNNAGISAPGGMMQAPDVFRRIIAVNLVGPYLMCQAIAPAMAARGSGVIVNITSAAGTVTTPAVGAYGPSKAGLLNLTKALALEYAPSGVRVNAVAPGFIAAGLGAGPASDPAVAAARSARVPARSLGKGEDVAAVVVFLASEAARYVHGQEIIVDGGLTLTALTNMVAQ